MTGTGFDHLTTGTAESAWQQDGRLDRLPTLPMPTPDDHIVIVAAHPDDESLGAGGLLHQAQRCGARVTVVVATDGELSHPGSPTVPPPALATIRRQEVRRAVAELAPHAAVWTLALPDGNLEAFGPALATALAALAGTATLVVTPWSGDRHPDHAATARAGAELAGRLGVPHWQYPVWMWHWAQPGDPEVPWDRLRTLSLSSSDLAAKSAAVRSHHSQVEPLSDAPGDEAVLPPGTVEHFHRRAEPFVVGDPASRSGDAADSDRFDALYRRDPDPWGLGSRFYEQRKRETLLAALPRARFRRAFEPGCATGLITTALAARCDEVVAWDVATRAVEQTVARLRDDGRHDRVLVDRGRIPDQWPDGRFDLIVLSEVGYYCDSLDDLAARVTASLAADGVVVGCHWRHQADEHAHAGDAVHEALGRRLSATVSHVEEDFLLHVWGSGPFATQSVARLEGIVG